MRFDQYEEPIEDRIDRYEAHRSHLHHLTHDGSGVALDGEDEVAEQRQQTAQVRPHRKNRFCCLVREGGVEVEAGNEKNKFEAILKYDKIEKCNNRCFLGAEKIFLTLHLSNFSSA